MGLSMTPINAFRTIPSTENAKSSFSYPGALLDGEIVMYVDKAMCDATDSALSSFAVTYKDETNNIQTVYPFTTVSMGFMTNNEVTTMVNRIMKLGGDNIFYTITLKEYINIINY